MITALICKARLSGISLVYMQQDGGPGAIDEQGAPGFEIHPDFTPRNESRIPVKCFAHNLDWFTNIGFLRYYWLCLLVEIT